MAMRSCLDGISYRNCFTMDQVPGSAYVSVRVACDLNLYKISETAEVAEQRPKYERYRGSPDVRRGAAFQEVAVEAPVANGRNLAVDGATRSV